MEDPASTKRGISEYPTFFRHFFDWGNSNQLHLHLAKLVTPLLKAKLLVIICKFTPKLKMGANLGFEGTTPPPSEEKIISTEKRKNHPSVKHHGKAVSTHRTGTHPSTFTNWMFPKKMVPPNHPILNRV